MWSPGAAQCFWSSEGPNHDNRYKVWQRIMIAAHFLLPAASAHATRHVCLHFHLVSLLWPTLLSGVDMQACKLRQECG